MEPLDLLKKEASGKCFIHIDSPSEKMVKVITPDGWVRVLNKDLFILDVDTDIKNAVSNKQIEKLNNYIKAREENRKDRQSAKLSEEFGLEHMSKKELKSLYIKIERLLERN